MDCILFAVFHHENQNQGVSTSLLMTQTVLTLPRYDLALTSILLTPYTRRMNGWELIIGGTRFSDRFEDAREGIMDLYPIIERIRAKKLFDDSFYFDRCLEAGIS